MSVNITTDVFCDYCVNWCNGYMDITAKPRQSRRKAKRAGWERKYIGGRYVDICPLCLPVVMESKRLGNEQSS